MNPSKRTDEMMVGDTVIPDESFKTSPISAAKLN